MGAGSGGKQILFVAAMFLMLGLGMSGCSGGSGQESAGDPEKEDFNQREEITIMHVDAGKEEFRQFITLAEERLNLRIRVLEYPINADSRHAKVSSLLAAGDSAVDVFSINDEMVSEFKHAGYLEPLQHDVMDQETAKAFPQDYLQQMVMLDGQIYSAPYMMDIMVLWVNDSYLREAGISDVTSREDFLKFLSYDWGEGRYAYGGAWEKTYVYNEIGEFINLFGGDYYDWNHEKTREAVKFLRNCVIKGYTPKNQLIDQYEQMNQKFIDGKYGMVFLYSGSMNTYVDAGIYGPEKIHLIPLPQLGENTTYIATWQYALNKASKNKEAAKRFISYAVSREGGKSYAEKLHRMPAREDLIWEEKLHVPGFDEMKEYLNNVKLIARPMPEHSMAYVSSLGELFQTYIAGEMGLEEFCDAAGALVSQNLIQ